MYSILDLNHNLAMIRSNERAKLRVRARLGATVHTMSALLHARGRKWTKLTQSPRR
jgi:hypothetical protein